MGGKGANGMHGSACADNEGWRFGLLCMVKKIVCRLN